MTPKALDKYPNVYSTIIRQGYFTGVYVPCPDKIAAIRLRQDLYNFRQVLQDRALHEDELRPLGEMSKALTLCIDHSNSRLFIYHREREFDETTIQEINL